MMTEDPERKQWRSRGAEKSRSQSCTRRWGQGGGIYDFGNDMRPDPCCKNPLNFCCKYLRDLEEFPEHHLN